MMVASFTTTFAEEDAQPTEETVIKQAADDLDSGYSVDEGTENGSVDNSPEPTEEASKPIVGDVETQGESTGFTEIITWADESNEETSEETEGTVEESHDDEIMSLSNNIAPNITNVTTLSYSTHVQDYGWMNTVTSKQTSGTTGQSKRVEALKVGLPSELASLGDIKVETHVQDYGWLGAVGNNQIAGTTGQSKRVEALKIYLTGELANQYNVVYRVHVQDIGWQKWKRNGAVAGTTGQSKRIEAIEIYLQSKADMPSVNSVSTSISTSAHVQDYGWMNAVGNNQVAGTTGQSKRLEAITVTLNDDMACYGDIDIQAHVQDYGWLSTVHSGDTAGTTGQNKRLEAIKISLTGDLSSHYDVYYRVHVGNIGWLGWTKNGEVAGSVGCNRKLEAVQIAIYKKGDSNAPQTGNSVTTSVENAQYTPTYYSQRDGRWSGATYNGYSLYSTGCVPTSVAMAVDGILHNGVTPNIMADYLVTTGEFAGRKHGGSGLAIKYGAEHWGLKTNGIGSYNDLVNSLNAGKIVVFQVGAGTFTSRGSTHAIVLFRNSGGNTYVYDPWNAHNGWYSISMIWNQSSTNSYDLTGGYVGYGISQ
jgi:uncharacterized protein YjdB